MKYPRTLVLLATLGLAACAARTQSFGEPVSGAPAISANAVLGSPESYDGRTLVVEGTVSEVCQVKGCWMTIVSEDREIRVKFKDYGFFVPLNSGGRRVRIEGVFAREMVSVEDARHYLEDAGKAEEAAAITEPVPSFTFLASGVTILN